MDISFKVFFSIWLFLWNRMLGSTAPLYIWRGFDLGCYLLECLDELVCLDVVGCPGPIGNTGIIG